MNYKSQLKSWAIDRAIRLREVNFRELDSMEAIKKAADDLVAYAYQGEEDFADACKRMVECLKEMPDALEKVNQVQQELLFIEEQMQAQLARTKTANGTAKPETVQ